MIVVHAVVPRGTGIDVRPLRRHDSGQVTVLYEEAPEPPPHERAAVVEHGHRVVSLADQVPLLPMRYGTTLPGIGELRAVAEDRADEWSQRLAQLAGRCELVVHVDLASPVEHASHADSGRAFLLRRTARLQRHERALEEVRALVAPWSEEQRVLTDRARVAVLVRRQDADDASRAVTDWGHTQDDLQVVVTGPWPPFSFCEEGDLS
jgi:hypothetical protein